jgi:hypothetical protein
MGWSGNTRVRTAAYRFFPAARENTGKNFISGPKSRRRRHKANCDQGLKSPFPSPSGRENFFPASGLAGKWQGSPSLLKHLFRN